MSTIGAGRQKAGILRARFLSIRWNPFKNAGLAALTVLDLPSQCQAGAAHRHDNGLIPSMECTHFHGKG